MAGAAADVAAITWEAEVAGTGAGDDAAGVGSARRSIVASVVLARLLPNGGIAGMEVTLAAVILEASAGGDVGAVEETSSIAASLAAAEAEAAGGVAAADGG